VIIEGGLDGTPVDAWIGGTHQPTLYSAVDGQNPQDSSVHWSFQNQEGAQYRVKAGRPAGKDEHWFYWHWIDMKRGIYEVSDEATGFLNGEQEVHFQLICDQDPGYLIYKAMIDAYRYFMTGQ
jgi:hypothetical protein